MNNFEESQLIKLAKVLAEIHSHSLKPYYSTEKSSFWDELEIKSPNKDEVDQEFFLSIAKDIISSKLLQ